MARIAVPASSALPHCGAGRAPRVAGAVDVLQAVGAELLTNRQVPEPTVCTR